METPRASARYARFGMPLGGPTARELIVNELQAGLPLKRLEIAKRIGDVHHANGGRTMERSKVIGVAKKELKLMLEDNLVDQPASGWYVLRSSAQAVQSEYSSIPKETEAPVLRLPDLTRMSQINEAQTQRSVIEPILNGVLGWDITDHTRVHVEKALEAEISTNFVDYALDHDGDGKYEILIEAKRLDAPLSTVEIDQLLRYMKISTAQLGILTNGSTWLFFDRQSDSATPILDFHLLELTSNDELQRAFTLLSYDDWKLDRFVAWARTNSYKREVSSLIESEIFDSPSDDLIEFFIKKARPNSPVTKRMIEGARTSFEKVVNDWINQEDDEIETPSSLLIGETKLE